ncbi:MAG: Fur family transcriptional regulator [Pseudomonadota bacterium]
MSRIEKLCAQRNMRMTDQRRIIARALSNSLDHPDVEEIHKRAFVIDSNISVATVYRTLRFFEESGVVTRHDFGDGRGRYEETNDDHHDHLIDLETGEVIEFKNEEIEILQQRVAKELGYTLRDHRLELFGVKIKS